MRTASVGRTLGLNLASIVLIAFFALPIFYLISGAFMSRADVYSGAILPSEIQTGNIWAALFEYDMIRYFFNSVVLTSAVVVANVFFCSLVGFALAKYDFPGKNLLFGFVLVAMIVPPLVLIVPLFLEVQRLGLLNTPWAIILPGFIDPFGIFLMRQFIVDIADDHLDAARIEGASEFGIFWRVVLPLSAPAVVALILYRFLFVWNDLFWPILVLGGSDWRPLPVAIQAFSASTFEAPELTLATALVGAIPILIILLVGFRQVFNAVSRTGGLK